MPVDIDEVLKRTRDIVLEGKRNNSLHEMTPRLVRERIELDLSLEAGELNVGAYRTKIKEVIQALLAEFQNEPKHTPSPDKVDIPSSPAELPKKRKAPNQEDGKAKKQKQDVPAKPQSRRKTSSSKELKSSEMVPTSDIEPDAEEAGPSNEGAPSKRSRPASLSDPPTRETKVLRTLPLVSTDVDVTKQTAAAPSKTSTSRAKPTISSKRDISSHQSDSETSIILDEPKRARKPKEKASLATSSRTKSSKSESKDDETIKKLKSLVVACGVRKVWSKVLSGLDRPSQQISKLKEILAELGMTGRLSMEKAKAIKEKRELAKELADVNEFNKTVNAGSASKNRGSTKKTAASSDTEEQGESDGESEVERPVKRRNNARTSIMAFLADQSDED